MAKSTDIVLVWYGDRTELDRCIASIEMHCRDYGLIVIDNNIVNRGFTKAVNEGIKLGQSDYIWLINQDAVVLDGAQQALIYRFSQNNKVGIVGSMQLDPDNPDMIRHGGTLRAFPAGAHKGGYVSMGHCQIPSKETWVNFASVMLRRSMVKTIGPLDERMFLLYSDSDYCYWARRNGWEVWYEPRSRVLHKLKASRGVTEWHQKDMLAFMKKWGIVPISENQFQYSREFRNLDLLP